MVEAKTNPTTADIDEYLKSCASPEQLADYKTLMAKLKRVDCFEA
jgi:hypothetical protein